MLLLSLLACGGDLRGPLKSTLLSAEALAPNRAQLSFWLRDADGLGVDDWSPDELSLEVEGELVDASFVPTSERDLRTPWILLLDVSEDGDLQATFDVAQALLDAREPGQPAQILAFADGVETLSPLTSDGETLQAALDGFSAMGPTTNLRDAVLVSLGEWEDSLLANTGLQRGVLVVVSDGGQGPDPTTSEDIAAAAGDKAIVGVDLGAGKDLEVLATAGVAQDAAGAVELVQRASGAVIVATWCSDADADFVFGVDFRRGRLRSSFTGTIPASGFGAVGLENTNPLPEPIRDLNGVILGDWLIVGGGDADGSTYSAPILPDGRLGHWRTGAQIPSGENTRMHGVGESLYAVNGDQAWVSSLVDGVVQSWEEMESPGYANQLRSDDSSLYSIARQRVFQASAGGGAVGAWSVSEDIPEGGLDNYVGGGIAGGTLYVVGSWRSGPGEAWESRGWFTDAQSMDAWTELTLPGGYLGTWLSVADDGERLLLLPGSDADDRRIWIGTPDTDGQLLWEEGPSLAMERDAYSAAMDEQGRIYLHGGESEDGLLQVGVRGRLGEEGLELVCE
ncbi:MAG: VWA domain-containing protein [Myxococcota bacterium]|nr:VWA domain-containing protein [Myxococcota bacterium]